MYVSIIYNISICLALYCLAMFWLCVNDDLKPYRRGFSFFRAVYKLILYYRPVPKFLCVKGILFFSFWQSFVISILVAASVITRLGPYVDSEHISVGLNDTLICIEMPFFSLAHFYAFNYTDYIDSKFHFCARMKLYHAFLDAFSIKDVIQDTKATLRGKGMDYREFEPAEGEIHQGAGRDRRIRAGLRYSKGGKKKYWLPQARAEGDAVNVHAPLLGRQAQGAVHLAPDMMPDREDPMVWDSLNHDGDDTCGYDLPFGDLDPADEILFGHSRQYLFGDYNYPVIDVSDEGARTTIWHEEERVLRDERGAWESPIRNVRVGIQGKLWEGYGAIGSTETRPVDGVKDTDPSFSRREDTEHPQKTNEAWLRSPPVLPGAHKGLLIPDIQRVESSTASSTASSISPSTSSGPSSSTTIRQYRISPAMSKTSSLSPSPKPTSKSEKSRSKEKAKVERSALPPDAIDLVVEDHKASTMIKGRPGEPPVKRKDGLKNVYRRESTQDGQQIEVGEQPAHEISVEGLVESKSAGRMEDFERSLQDATWESDGPTLPATTGYMQDTTTIARAGTPPAHLRMMYDELEDDNPWA